MHWLESRSMVGGHAAGGLACGKPLRMLLLQFLRQLTPALAGDTYECAGGRRLTRDPERMI
jgi:hypothetical protein